MIAFLVFVALLIFFMVRFLIQRHKYHRKESEKMGDAPDWDDFIFVDYKGEKVPMRVSEYHDMWQFMDRKQKREAVMAIKRGIKKGRLSGHMLGRDNENIPVYATE